LGYLLFDLCSFRTNARLVLKLITIQVFHKRTYSLDVMYEAEIVLLNNSQTSHRTHRTSINNFFVYLFILYHPGSYLEVSKFLTQQS